ncbi:hypothetical protein D9619_002590 [Psilocybe cf. subviscida]|uniref:Uncharacterized protein n=1 Tax=Psilocybe cf. subviscida TaxID=2480587 RepID=A0A8H5EUQ5_9AGAR|nr:hypothetical protein D9619_002590 [Psilocybe cf. subviscida]
MLRLLRINPLYSFNSTNCAFAARSTVTKPRNLNQRRTMSSNTKADNSSELNAAGLRPEESKALAERSMQPHEGPIVQAIKEMYSCKPTNTTFDIYAPNAVFHDPIGIAEGVGSIRNQFVGLAKIFDRADIPKFRILQNPSTVPPHTILIDQDVAYFRKDSNNTPTKTVNSLLTIKLDPASVESNNPKILSHNEEWDHKKTTSSEDGFFGMLNEGRKKMAAGLTDLFVGNKDAPDIKSKN